MLGARGMGRGGQPCPTNALQPPPERGPVRGPRLPPQYPPVPQRYPPEERSWGPEEYSPRPKRYSVGTSQRVRYPPMTVSPPSDTKGGQAPTCSDATPDFGSAAPLGGQAPVL